MLLRAKCTPWCLACCGTTSKQTHFVALLSQTLFRNTKASCLVGDTLVDRVQIFEPRTGFSQIRVYHLQTTTHRRLWLLAPGSIYTHIRMGTVWLAVGKYVTGITTITEPTVFGESNRKLRDPANPPFYGSAHVPRHKRVERFPTALLCRLHVCTFATADPPISAAMNVQPFVAVPWISPSRSKQSTGCHAGQNNLVK